MKSPDPTGFNEVLRDARKGDTSARRRFWELAHEQLERPAKVQLAADPRVHRVMETGSLVREAWIDLVGQQDLPWENRIHFLRAAAKIMRQIRCDRARKMIRLKHGGGVKHVPLDNAENPAVTDAIEKLAINDALSELEQIRPRAAEIVELRFFGGLTVDETAEALGVSPRTVDSDWAFARSWLHQAIEGDSIEA